MKIQDLIYQTISIYFLHCFGPLPINLKPKQDTVKLYAIVLLLMMTNMNVTVLHNLLHRGLTRATNVLAQLIFQHLCDQISAHFQD